MPNRLSCTSRREARLGAFGMLNPVICSAPAIRRSPKVLASHHTGNNPARATTAR